MRESGKRQRTSVPTRGSHTRLGRTLGGPCTNEPRRLPLESFRSVSQLGPHHQISLFVMAHAVVLGASGGIGQPLSQKQTPSSERSPWFPNRVASIETKGILWLSLYDIVNTPGVASDLSCPLQANTVEPSSLL